MNNEMFQGKLNNHWEKKQAHFEFINIYNLLHQINLLNRYFKQTRIKI